MYLSKLRIKNFRAIEELEIPFKKGVTIIVGENNAGKTAVMDALRIVTMSSSDFDAYKVTEDDFHEGNTSDSIEVRAELTALSTDDEIRMFEALVFKSENEVFAQLNSESVYNEEAERVKTRMTGGLENAGNAISDVYEHMDVTYLKPLRDPAQALKNGRFSCPAKFLISNLDKAQRIAMEEMARRINEELIHDETIQNAQELYNKVLKNIIGENNAQDIELLFNDPNFTRLISDIKTKIGSREYHLNGLGLNNVLVIALVIAAHQKKNAGYQLLIIEEPEAHLHPLLQRLLLTYLKKIVREGLGNTQVVISTHSPVFASKAEIESICHISKDEQGVHAVSMMDIVCDVKCNNEDLKQLTLIKKKKLERFLDVTRAELFFTKKVILVEGPSEMLLLPVIAKLAGCDLDENNVTLINCMGLNFDIFIPVLEKIGIRTAIITDDDSDIGASDSESGNESANARKIQTWVSQSNCIKAFFTPQTFEKALFRNVRLRKLALDAVGNLGHPDIVRNMQVEGVDQMYARLFGKGKKTVTKGEFAQEMALLLEEMCNDSSDGGSSGIAGDAQISVEDFPDNIKRAINYVCRT